MNKIIPNKIGATNIYEKHEDYEIRIMRDPIRLQICKIYEHYSHSARIIYCTAEARVLAPRGLFRTAGTRVARV